MKKCSSCKEEKQLSEFYKTKTNLDGLSYVCKLCGLASARSYRKENKERYYFDQQAYRATPVGFVSQVVHNAKTRAKKKNFDFNLTNEDITNLMDKQDMRCAVTGIEMSLHSDTRKKANPFKCSLDRIDSNFGYTLDNVRLVCWAVNQMKSDRTEEEFKFWIQILHKAISSQA